MGLFYRIRNIYFNIPNFIKKHNLKNGETCNSYNKWEESSRAQNYTIFQAAEEIGIEIPALCYDPELK